MIDALSSVPASVPTDINSATRSAEANGDTRLLESSRDFSSLLIGQMLNTMRSTVQKQDNPLFGGLSQEIFEDFLYREYASILAHSGNLGIDKLIYEQLL